MSLSAQHKAYKANGGRLNFADYAEACDRAAHARSVREANKAARKVRAKTVRNPAVKQAVVKSVTPSFERIENRVDCMGASKKGIVFIGVDKADAKKVQRILKATTVRPYTSKRGERVLLSAKSVDTEALIEAGFAPKGF